MPIYLFEHPTTMETIEMFFHMNDEKRFTDSDGQAWNRVYTSSQLSSDSSVDPWNASQFVDKTKKQKGTMGDLLDQSAELSRKRAEEHDGVDPMKSKYFDKYSKDRGGAKHPDEKKTYESKNVKIEFD